MNRISLFVIPILTLVILLMLLVEYVQSLSMESTEQSTPIWWPGRGDWVRDLMTSNQFVAIGAFIVVIGGILSSLGYTIYKIFFKYK